MSLEREGRKCDVMTTSATLPFTLAARFRTRITGAPNPVGPVSERVLAGYRRRARKRGRGQARPLTADGLAASLATAHLPRETGRGRESDEVARRRGTMDCAIAGLLFHAGMRRSELAALEWRDIEEAPSLPDAILVTVRASKTNQAGERADVRMVKNGAADALRKLRDSAGEAPEARVIPLSPSHIGHRLQPRRERRVWASSLRTPDGSGSRAN